MVIYSNVIGHATHCCKNEISFPQPHTPRIPHTCIIAQVQPDDGQHTGPKHVVVPRAVLYPLYY